MTFLVSVGIVQLREGLVRGDGVAEGDQVLEAVHEDRGTE
jgi:hypothetical protein